MNVDQPLFRVEHGSPSTEELAVVTAVLTARLRAGGAPAAEAPRAAWTVTRLGQAGAWSVGPSAAWQTAV
ncbi:acyl-CoA carboxylase subunit epsilon [Streptomyces sp. NRRL WC-3742]|uniref:acyl-CoA carboxylase subunit epsilon n=1 Tax=Streptomyces sp. NRRL WC-3742 TaxID=1463934 RepID=UPI0004C5DAA3|nr:acyl-CoA carboxylase subunit epsilon [Streptomyces sp. NRRL WC-3742]